MISISAARSYALTTQQNKTSKEVEKIYEQLSSGKRINRASDDAAAFQLATKESTDATVYGQAVRNVNDAISLLDVADSTVSSLTSILTSMEELATQSANSTYSSTQRQALDTEFQSLRSEYNRIVESTSYNNKALFSGSTHTYNIQAGYGDLGVIPIHLAATGSEVLPTGTYSASTTFDSRTSAGRGVLDVILVDINEDGNLDILGANPDEGDIRISFGNGDGTFDAAVTHAVSLGIIDIVAHDLDGDDNLDLLVTDQSSGDLSILLGDGTGGFAAPVVYAGVGGDLRDGTVGDVDGDGNDDFVTISQTNDKVVVFSGNGDGTFQTPVSYAATGETTTIGLADFDEDGDLDILTTERTNDKVNVLLNNGSGTFAAAVSFATGVSPFGAHAVDLNNDGHLDIAVGTSLGNGFFVHTGNGDGTFNAGVSYGATPSGRLAVPMDVNGDGNIDIIGGQSSNRFDVYLGNGDGTFGTSTSYAVNGVGVVGIELGDINNDGALDLAMSVFDNTSHYIQYHLGSSALQETAYEIGTLGGMNIRTVATAQSSLDSLGQYQIEASRAQGAIGASLSRMSSAEGVTIAFRDMHRAAQATIEDVDVAAAAAELAHKQVAAQAGYEAVSASTEQMVMTGRIITDSIA